MGIRARFRVWRTQRRRAREVEWVRLALARIGAEYETFPKLLPLRNGNWAVTAPRYRPVISDTPQTALLKFRARNRPRRA